MKNIEIVKDQRKSKNIVLIITTILNLLIAVSFFFNKYIVFLDGTQIFYVVMLLYFGLEFTNYLLTKKNTGMFYLYKSLAYIIASVSGLKYISEPSPYVIGYTLIGWSIIMLIIKLIKIEDLRNKLNSGIIINLFSMSLFILLCFLVITNILVGISNESMILGFFFTANSILNIVETFGTVVFEK